MKSTALLLLAGLSTAQAAEPTSLTLACQGTVTVSTSMSGKPDIDEAPDPISMGIIFNLTERTVSGLAFPVTIDSIEDVDIRFSGSRGSDLRVIGSVDRVTGDAEITTTVVMSKTSARSYRYSLKCKPTQRMF
jgi:hypothetical protein